MVASAGRKLRIKYDSGAGLAVIAGAISDSLTIANEPIDITDKDDAGIVTLLDDIGTKQVNLTVSGNMKDSTLFELTLAAGEGTALADFDIDISALGVMSGAFFINNFEAGGDEGANAMTFSCTLASSGPVTFV